MKGADVLVKLGFVVVELCLVVKGPMSYERAYAKLQQMKKQGEIAEQFTIDESRYTNTSI